MSLCDGTVILEPARPSDARATGRIMSDWIDEAAWMPRVHSRPEGRAHLADMIERGWVDVARRCGQPVGFLARDGGEIHALYLERTARGQGVGAALLTKAKARTDRLALWTFQANEAAQRFYLREGFHEVSRSDGAGNDEGLPDIRYQWSKYHE